MARGRNVSIHHIETPETKLIRLKTETKQMTFEDIYKHFNGICRWFAHKYDRQYEYEDMYQIALIALWKAYCKYEIDNKSEFASYMFTAIQNDLNNYNRTNENKFSVARANVASMDEQLKDVDEGSCTLKDILQSGKDDISYLLQDIELKQAIEKLKPMQQKYLVEYFFNDLNYAAIAEKYNAHNSSVHRSVSKCLPKLKLIMEV